MKDKVISLKLDLIGIKPFIFQSFCELSEKYQTSDLRNCEDHFGPQIKLHVSMLGEKNIINSDTTVY